MNGNRDARPGNHKASSTAVKAQLTGGKDNSEKPHVRNEAGHVAGDDSRKRKRSDVASKNDGMGNADDHHSKKNQSNRGGKTRSNNSSNKRKKKGSKDPLLELAPKYLAAHRIGTSPEEIAQWRVERRKNYPTRENVLRKEVTAKSGHEEAPPQDADTQNHDDEPRGSTAGRNKPSPKQKRADKLCFRFAKGSCQFGDRCHYSHDADLKTQHLIQQRKKTEKSQFLRATARAGGRDSLLRKLLLPDIRRERAVILKCIRSFFLLSHRGAAAIDTLAINLTMKRKGAACTQSDSAGGDAGSVARAGTRETLVFPAAAAAAAAAVAAERTMAPTDGGGRSGEVVDDPTTSGEEHDEVEELTTRSGSEDGDKADEEKEGKKGKAGKEKKTKKKKKKSKKSQGLGWEAIKENGVPSILFPLPLLYMLRELEWTQERVVMGQVLVVLETLMVLGCITYISNCVENDAKRSESIWLPPHKYANSTETQKKEGIPIEVTEYEQQTSEVWQAQKAVAISCTLALFLPRIAGINQPIIMQAVLIPVIFVRNKLFQMYVLGWEFDNPWGAQTLEEVKAEAPELEAELRAAQRRKDALRKLDDEDMLDVQMGTSDGTKELRKSMASNIVEIAEAGFPSKKQLERFAAHVDVAVTAEEVNFSAKPSHATLAMVLCKHLAPTVDDMVSRLADNGLDLLRADSDGWNAVHWAAFYANEPVLKVLLAKARADGILDDVLTAKTLDDSVALDIARTENAPQSVLASLAA
ncbi:Ankyrin repeat domain-containing protein 1 [Durusdinium trenchii]|uniref:Ankyrin repeat domain-containing protein 1 n=1 Tax=Durusdinium trenchii TaxID=1381693 RepID=A0ABP0RDL9_9DINO